MRKILSLLTAILFVGTMWGALSSPYTCTFTGGMSVVDSKVTTGDVTWTIATTVGKGSPDISFGNQNGQTCIKFGAGKSNYYSSMTLTTSAFSSYNVTKVVLYVSSNNGGSKTITVKQNTTTIGTKSQSFSSTTWVNNSTYNTNSGNGGDLEIRISSDATATYVHSIQVYYTIPTYEVTIPNLDHTTLTVKNTADETVASGTELPAGARLYVSAESNDETAYRVAAKVYKTGDASTVVAIDETDSITMPAYAITISAEETPVYAVSIAVNDGEMGSAKINGGTATIYASEEDDDITLVATPKTGYEFVNWTVTTGEASDITISSSTSASTTAGLVTGPVTVTANFQAQSCTNLAAPTLNEVTKTYNSATIAWNSVANAEGYLLNITKHSDASAILTDELIVAPAVSFEKTGLLGNTQYDYTVMAVGDGSTYCDESNPLLEGNFTTEDYPAATLTLSENQVERALAGSHKLNDVIKLPTTVVTGVVNKVLAGWTTGANKNYSDANDAPDPFYAKGTNYTIASTTDKLYAVYATIASDDPTITKLTSNSFDADATYLIGAAAGVGTHYFYSYSAVDENIWGLMDAIDEETPIEFTLSGTASALKIKDGSNNYVKGVSSSFQMSASEFSLKLDADGTIHADIDEVDYNLRYNTSYGLRFYNKSTGNSAYLYSIIHDYTYNGYVTTGSVPTATETIETSEKVVKTIVNGQLFIEKNGKVYNILGTLVK